MTVSVGVDVGGTFTDVVLAAGGRVHARKLLTTHDDPRVAVAEGVRLAIADAGVLAGDIERVVHGTTLATNVILERKGGRIAFVTTAGFGDLLRLGREARVEEERYDLFFRTPEPPIAHELTFEADERIDARGNVLVPLQAAEAEVVAARVAAARPDAVAICFLHAYANPEHEQLMASACRAALGPTTFVAASSDIWPEMREHERAMTTVMCAYVAPVMATYLDGLEARLAELGITCPIEIMESGGGVASAAAAARRPIATVESGGAAGVIAAGQVGQLLGAAQVISFDMGGTTAKAGIVRDGRPDVVHDFQIGGKGSFGGTRPGTGFPVKIPVVDLAEVGAGGGSIAWVDAGGALRVGPHSSGSVPGPACYERGGVEPTVTDANLVLGYLDPAGLAGGVTLSVARAEDAIGRAVASSLGTDVPDAARGIHEVVNANMAAAIRVVTVQRGVDPRPFTLVGFGGAGPMHVARLAETFGITSVAVPWAAGVASAVGLVGSDPSVERVRTKITPADDAAAGGLDGLFGALERDCRVELGERGGHQVVVERSVDARYRGQAHQLTIAVDDMTAVAKRFREHYADAYGIDLDAPVEIVNARVRVTRLVDKPNVPPQPVAAAPDPTIAVRATRPAFFADAGGFVSTPVYDWASLPVGSSFLGPAIVEGADSTIVVPPTCTAEVDRWRTVLLRPALSPAPSE